MRYAMLIILVIFATGCARDVVMVNPRTGERVTCREDFLNPWSQGQACIGEHIAEGWRRASD